VSQTTARGPGADQKARPQKCQIKVCNSVRRRAARAAGSRVRPPGRARNRKLEAHAAPCPTWANGGVVPSPRSVKRARRAAQTRTEAARVLATPDSPRGPARAPTAASGARCPAAGRRTARPEGEAGAEPKVPRTRPSRPNPALRPSPPCTPAPRARAERGSAARTSDPPPRPTVVPCGTEAKRPAAARRRRRGAARCRRPVPPPHAGAVEARRVIPGGERAAQARPSKHCVKECGTAAARRAGAVWPRLCYRGHSALRPLPRASAPEGTRAPRASGARWTRRQTDEWAVASHFLCTHYAQSIPRPTRRGQILKRKRGALCVCVCVCVIVCVCV
jgi:hypothetical protein